MKRQIDLLALERARNALLNKNCKGPFHALIRAEHVDICQLVSEGYAVFSIWPNQYEHETVVVEFPK